MLAAGQAPAADKLPQAELVLSESPVIAEEPSDALTLKMYGGIDYWAASSERAQATLPHLRMHEIGISTRVRLKSAESWQLHIDYRGREPVGGEISNSALRLLFEAQGQYFLLDGMLGLGAGRFMAPAAIFLVMDGAWVQLKFPVGLSLRASGGRRAISSSRRNIAFSNFLPAASADLEFKGESFGLRLMGGLAGDEAILLAGTESQSASYSSMSARISAWYRPFKSLDLRGALSAVEQATYTLGPTWADAPLSVHATDLVQAYGRVLWRPMRSLRMHYSYHHQKPHLAIASDESRVVNSTFDDHRAGIGIRPYKVGWVRLDYRHRTREDRVENRFRLRTHLYRMGVEGLFVKGQVARDVVSDAISGATNSDENRFQWLGSVGYRDRAFDLEMGASFVERSGEGVSGRGAINTTGQDLSPFMLMAERIIFARGFYYIDEYFLGFDVERNISEGEYRFFTQLGLRLERDL